MGAGVAKRQPSPSDGGKSDDRSGRKTAPIQVEKELAKKIAIIATYRGVTQNALIEPVLRDFIAVQYRLFQEEMAKALQQDQKKSQGG